MHLLLAQKGTIQEGEEAVDLDQSPADIVFLSAADTELASLAAAAGNCGDAAPKLRLARLLDLTHPMSIDIYAQKTVARSRMVVVRVLGGKAYWAYGLEKLRNVCLDSGVKLAVLPGDDKPDAELGEYSTIDAGVCSLLHRYLREGGPENAANFLKHCRFLLGDGAAPPGPVLLMRAGLYYPGLGICGMEALRSAWKGEQPVTALVFYRALVQSGGLAPVDSMVAALAERGCNVMPVFVSSLKEPLCSAMVQELFSANPPEVVLNATGFSISSPGEDGGTILDASGAVVMQVILSGSTLEEWQNSSQGLTARDLAMNVALPEVDGRIITRAIAFKHAQNFDAQVEANIVVHRPLADRVAFAADLAARWIRLGREQPARRRVALVLANYPNRDGRIGNGVGLDTPAAAVEILASLAANGYETGSVPGDGDTLVRTLQAGPTNQAREKRSTRETLPLEAYREFFAALPEPIRREVTERWGQAQDDPLFDQRAGHFTLPVMRCGSVAVGIQPARGYQIDPKKSYHSPDLVPPHGYFAFHAWLRRSFDAHAVIHLGKHGNLEWLPGKALALSRQCYPEAALGPLPHLYPFIVNDPGEGSQAKRRSAAVIVDHLTPPLTRADSYGPLRDLEGLVDEYYEASVGDPRRLQLLARRIFELAADTGVDIDAGIGDADGEEARLTKLDAWLCELKELQIRDGLHIFGVSPEGQLATDLAVAIARVPRGGRAGDESLQGAIAADLVPGFDPLDCDMARPWNGPRPAILAGLLAAAWRSAGDTVERIELLASALVAGKTTCEAGWTATPKVLQQVRDEILPAISQCGPREMAALLRGLDGRFVAPGPSGAPSRGRPDVLPTGRNFYSVDSRAVPTRTAWELGAKSAELLIVRYRQDHGDWPTSFGLSAWGTSNMRTGGDDIAQALALIGAKPVWDNASHRVTGYSVLTLAELGRPRVDVTLRISGFFRDAFPAQIELYDKAIRAIGALDEAQRDNPIAARMRADRARLEAQGVAAAIAERQAGFRVFGSKPGAYGAGLQALIDEKGWDRQSDLAEAYLAWGSYAYGAREEGNDAREAFVSRLSEMEAVIHNQDNREHDLLDSDDYYQFEGGMAAAVAHTSGRRPAIYHNDHSRPERPAIRALDEEIARVVRGRAANPKWIAGVMRHGYKGAFEMAATLDYLFAFSATTGAVRDHHFDLVHDAWIADEKVRRFIAAHNPAALREMSERFLEAMDRGLWSARSNSARVQLKALAEGREPDVNNAEQ
jgi:cobaltochelatase CobN